MGSKLVSKMAPRLIIFQYYDRAAMELEEQRKKLRVCMHKSEAEMLLFKRMVIMEKKRGEKGLSFERFS
jgi:hypothetical protein